MSSVASEAASSVVHWPGGRSNARPATTMSWAGEQSRARADPQETIRCSSEPAPHVGVGTPKVAEVDVPRWRWAPTRVRSGAGVREAGKVEFGAEPEVRADVFVFSVQTCKDPQRYDVLDLSQSEF